MILNLYGDGLLFQSIAQGFVEAHKENLLKFDVVQTDKAGSKFKDAVKKAFNSKFLDDADAVVRFAVPNSAEQPPQEDEPEQPEEGQPEGEEDSGNETVKEAEGEGVTAVSAKIKKDVIETMKRRLFIAEDIELFDLPGFADGYDVFFAKISFMDGDGAQTA